jgi:competence protein ComEC
MIDTGPTGFGNQKAAKPSWMQLRTIGWFRHHDINTIDLLVLSHLHDDHAGGLKDLLRNLNVRNLMLSSTETNTTEWQQLMQSGLLKEAQIKIISDTLTFPFANSTISVLNPAKGFNTGDENDNSLVLRLDYKNFSALMAGDITSKAEEHLIESNPVKLDCDLLKVPHHGSKYSSSADFIRAVSPRQAIITAPLHNRFHFPDKESMARYHAYGIEPQLTGNGSVVVTIP